VEITSQCHMVYLLNGVCCGICYIINPASSWSAYYYCMGPKVDKVSFSKNLAGNVVML
jgi:hypothetical protein